MDKISVVRRVGGSRIIAITKLLPSHWQVVSVEVVKTDKDYVTLKVNKVG